VALTRISRPTRSAVTGNVPSRNQRQAVCRFTPTDSAQSARFTLYDRGIAVEVTAFHQVPAGADTATFVRGCDARSQWAMG
jgi:hypothetical protein